MTEIRCGYAGDREGMLIAYLYDDADPASRAEFQRHLAVCDPCRTELDALSGVRTTLARWNPPEPQSIAARDQQAASGQPSAISQQPWWKQIPAWAQVAAALLFLGVSAGIANLDVRYDSNGLAIRTGWMTPPAPASAAAPPAPVGPEQIGVASQSASAAATTADLTALERRLRDEFRSVSATSTATATPVRAAANDAEILRKVRALIEETERRQQRELALRIAQALTDVNAQRQADLRKIDVGLDGVRNSLGVEVLKQRQSLNYLMRVSQRQ